MSEGVAVHYEGVCVPDMLLIRFGCPILPGDPCQGIAVNGFFQYAQKGK